MLGLRRLRKSAVWLEYLPSAGDRPADEANITNFRRRLREHGLSRNYCLIYDPEPNEEHDFGRMRCMGMSRKTLLGRLGGANVLLNLSYSLHPPFLLQF